MFTVIAPIFPLLARQMFTSDGAAGSKRSQRKSS
jgi:hypothetical protein